MSNSKFLKRRSKVMPNRDQKVTYGTIGAFVGKMTTVSSIYRSLDLKSMKHKSILKEPKIYSINYRINVIVIVHTCILFHCTVKNVQ